LILGVFGCRCGFSVIFSLLVHPPDLSMEQMCLLVGFSFSSQFFLSFSSNDKKKYCTYIVKQIASILNFVRELELLRLSVQKLRKLQNRTLHTNFSSPSSGDAKEIN